MSAKQQLATMKSLIADSLKFCCKEILEWKETGLLCDGDVRLIATALQDFPYEVRLDMVVSEIHNQAMLKVVG